MHKLLKLALISAATFTVASSAFAQEFHVETNKTKQLKLRGSASSVVIGNPRIADIAVHDQNLIFITGRSSGTTNLLIFNSDGRQIYESDIVVAADTSTQIAINRGGARNTYNCAPRCEAAAVVGDAAEYFNNVIAQNDTLLTQGEDAS